MSEVVAYVPVVRVPEGHVVATRKTKKHLTIYLRPKLEIDGLLREEIQEKAKEVVTRERVNQFLERRKHRKPAKTRPPYHGPKEARSLVEIIREKR